MRVLGLIVARGGSKGIPGKNIKLLGKQPLLAYVAKDALLSSMLDRVIISTDDLSIARVAKDCGIDVPFIRPSSLAQDNTPTLDVVEHAVQFLEANGEEYDAICLLQPTSPFKPRGFIDRCIEKFLEQKADSLISVLEVPHQFNPHWLFEPDENDYLKISTGDKFLIPRRQELPKAFYRDGSVYVFKVSNIMNQKMILYGQISYEVSNEQYYTNLDTMEDWESASKHPLVVN